MKLKFKGTKIQEWREKIKNREGECTKCKRVYYLTVDHIIPEYILVSFNLMDEVLNWEDNFQIICGACNMLKGNRLDVSHPKTFILLEEAILRAKNQITFKDLPKT